MIEPLDIEALPDCRLRITFSDGVEGVADLSDLAGKGVFAIWLESGAFERARIGRGRAIVTIVLELLVTPLHYGTTRRHGSPPI